MNNKIKELLENIDAQGYFIQKTFSQFIFGDLIFTILPILVIIFINKMLNFSFNKIILIPEWSFATIVLYGMVLTQTIELKTKIQRDTSYRLEVLTRFFIVCLIGSVIFLSIIILNEHVNIEISKSLLIAIQFILFFSSILWLAIIHFTRNKRIFEKSFVPKAITKQKAYRFLKESMEITEDEICYIVFLLSKITELKTYESSSFRASNIKKISAEKDFRHMFSKIEENLNSAKILYEKIVKESI